MLESGLVLFLPVADVGMFSEVCLKIIEKI
jgi:hypothetical protein